MTAAERFKGFTTRSYGDQGRAFLNAFWEEHEKDAEKIWTWAIKFAELDLDKKEEGCDLDEFNSHRFLESLKETKTVRQMRQEIREADMDFNKRLALLEYCLWKFKIKVGDFVERPQGGNEEEIMRCQAMVKAAQEALKQCQADERALKAALKALHAEEAAFNAKKEDLERKSQSGGMVSRNRAKNELAQHLGSDPLPLRRAKITTTAATKKAERSVANAFEKMAEAEAALAAAKLQDGVGQGNIWWMERDLAEARRFLPQRKK
eukprot:TRINITY_DN4562_c0_g1_i1.p3 TRINITY_DN4562_c0_g1~~TRINITY_DN4562_c0_g1_i1.p3  ORF type:complete len:264 (-),score=78.49 TRINITY_DN4562_c0_g1_i1:1135-1926(-)